MLDARRNMIRTSTHIAGLSDMLWVNRLVTRKNGLRNRDDGTAFTFQWRYFCAAPGRRASNVGPQWLSSALHDAGASASQSIHRLGPSLFRYCGIGALRACLAEALGFRQLRLVLGLHLCTLANFFLSACRVDEPGL